MRILAAAFALAVLAFGGGALAAGRFDAQRQLSRYLLGPKMVRAEVVVMDRGALRDLRIDRGRIVRLRPAAIVVLERDGRRLAVSVAADAGVQVDSVDAPLAALRRGMIATTVREGDGPATQVFAVTVP